MTSFSLTPFLNGKIKLYQPDKGYRFSIDAPLLADFIRADGDSVMFEIGGGCGIIPIILNFRGKGGKRIITVEIQRDLYELAVKNVKINNLLEKIEVLMGDVRDIYQSFTGLFDVVFSNPPYNPIEMGRISENLQRAIACHEIYLNIKTTFKITSWVLKEGGLFFVVFPYERENELLDEGRKNGFNLRRRKYVYSTVNSKEPFLVLLELKKGKTVLLEDEEEMAIYEKRGKYTEEFLRIIS